MDPADEIISEGNLGLMQAVRRFDPDKGFRLATYAMWWIRASIQEYVLVTPRNSTGGVAFPRPPSRTIRSPVRGIVSGGGLHEFYLREKREC